MAEKIVDFKRAQEEKQHQVKEEKMASIKDRFARAMGMQDKPKKKKSGIKKTKKKPGSDGW